MNGGKNSKPHSFGYTIIEVLLFVAISGFMFVVAAIFINGKQANAEFKQSVNSANTLVNTTINDVTNGFYPPAQNTKCDTSSGRPKLTTGGGVEQGANLSCVFMGKVIQFGVEGSGGRGLYIYTVMGCQFAACDNPSLSLTLPPVAATFSQSNPTAAWNPVDLTDKQTTQWGLQITRFYEVRANNYYDIGGIGFFSSFGSFDSSNNLKSGAQTVIVAGVPGSAIGQSEAIFAPLIQNIVVADSAPHYVICLDSGRGQKASITIGGGNNGQQLTTSVSIGSQADSKC